MLLGPKEVALLLGVASPKTAIRLFRSGDIPAFQLGGKLWRTRRETVDEYIAAQLALARCRAASAQPKHASVRLIKT